MDDTIESLKRQLETHRGNLNNLEEQKASYGSLDVPLRLLNQIKFEKKEIARLEEKIAELERRLKDPDAKKDSVPEKEPTDEEAREPKRGCMIWWGSLSDGTRVAYIGLIGMVIAASIGLIGVLGAPIITEWAKSRFAPTATSVAVAPTPTPTPTAMTTPTSTPTSAPTPSLTLPPTDIPSPTYTSTPMPSEEVVIEIDGVVKDASDGRCQEVDCGSSLRIEVKVLDSTGAKLQPDIFFYNWYFNPPDSHNSDKLDSKNYAINYYAPCERDNQTVTIEVLKGGETLGVRRVCFNIK